MNETFNYTFGPQWISWFKPNFTYNANYSWNQPRNSVIDAANLNLVKNTAVNLSISPSEIIETFYTPLSKRNSKPTSRTRSRGLASLDAEEEKSKDAKKESEKKKNRTEINSLFLERVYNESKKIEPLILTVTNNTNRLSNGVQGDIPLGYRLGFKDSHGISCLLYTSPSPRDRTRSRMPSSA